MPILLKVFDKTNQSMCNVKFSDKEWDKITERAKLVHLEPEEFVKRKILN